METIPTDINAIRELIANDEITEAIQKMNALLQGKPAANDLTILSSQYNDALRQERLGVASSDQVNLVKNKVRMGLLQILGNLGQGKANDAATQPTTENQGSPIIQQQAEKIYNIGHIDKADFS